MRTLTMNTRTVRLLLVLTGLALAAHRSGMAAVVQYSSPVHTYLGNNPHGTDHPDWSDNAQGVANDGQHWFFTNRNALFKYDANWAPVDGDDAGKLGSVTFPPELAALGINHFGDPDHYRGYVLVPFEGDATTIIAAFSASDLTLVDWVDVHSFQTRAGWVAVDPVEQVLYTSTDRIVAGTPLLRYALDVANINNGVHGDFLAPAAPMAILEADGSPVAGQFIYMQGGVFTPLGDLYLSVGKAGDSPEDTRGGLHLFRRSTDGSAFLLVESSVNSSTSTGFAYEYHPGSTGLGEEPEGIDWWNRDNATGSPYAGQLHAILLDNQIGDDQIWLKHYRVEYPGAGDHDTDGDGLSDADEMYVHNTDPRLTDTDGDGQPDGAELGCGSNPLDPANVDGDPPMLTCPAPATVECVSPAGVLSGDAQLVSFFAGVSATDACTSHPRIVHDAPAAFPLGSTAVTFTATDDVGNASTCQAAVTVVDTAPPAISVTLSHDTLWPPNHKLVPVTASVTVTDVCGPATFQLVSISSNEPDNGDGDGDTSEDIQGADFGTADTSFLLRAEWSGNSQGRQYTVVYRVTDSSGNVSLATAVVRVPGAQ